MCGFSLFKTVFYNSANLINTLFFKNPQILYNTEYFITRINPTAMNQNLTTEMGEKVEKHTVFKQFSILKLLNQWQHEQILSRYDCHSR